MFSEPSSHNFCESDYAVSALVAEFWNSVSMIPCALLCAWETANPALHLDVRVAFFISFLVAVGSFCMHATLTRWGQVADEVPMLWLGVWTIHLLSADIHSAYPRDLRRRRLWAACGAGAATVWYFVGTRNNNYFLFVVGFGTLCAIAAHFALQRISEALADDDHCRRSARGGGVGYGGSHRPLQARGMRQGVAVLALAASMWFFEECFQVNLHSLWHLTVYAGQWLLFSGI